MGTNTPQSEMKVQSSDFTSGRRESAWLSRRAALGFRAPPIPEAFIDEQENAGVLPARGDWSETEFERQIPNHPNAAKPLT